jgi:predicted alpha/beta superfamily hydrolase
MDQIIIERITIGELGGREREIRILLPDGYEKHPQKRYPVLYMHDGQNLIDPSAYSGYSWDVAETLDKLQRNGDTGGIIVVGIDNGEADRIAEYTHDLDPHAFRRVRKYLNGIPPKAEGIAYGRWLAQTLKPSIDARYRTLPDQEHNGVCGSSCGGNITLYMALAHHDVFGVFGVMSPAFWIIAKDAYKRIATTDLTNVRLYHDMGGREEKHLIDSALLSLSAARLQAILKKRIPEANLKFVYDPQARHNELFWQDRFPGFVRWAFPTPNTLTIPKPQRRQKDEIHGICAEQG